MKNWYAVHTKPRSETKANYNLMSQNIEVYLPRYFKMRRHARRVEKVKAPLFPRYLFVKIDIFGSNWRAINSTFGVSHIVCHNHGPAPIPEDLIDDIKLHEDSSGVIRLDRFLPRSPGDQVRILNGSLADQFGVFESECDEDRVVILLNILGRQTRVTTHSENVVACL